MCKILELEEQKQYPLFIDYGQLSSEKEWMACERVFSKSNLPKPTKMCLEGYGKLIKSGITDRSKDIYQDAFLPGRNLLFIVVAASYAYQKGVSSIAIGLFSEESHLFPDQTEEFLVNLNFALNSAFGHSFTIITPLINFGKKDVIKLAKKYSLPLEDTYSCHSGNDIYCGKCIACKEIISSGEKGSLPQFTKGGD
jgi:7-cyano-7-deazaguanine synthase